MGAPQNRQSRYNPPSHPGLKLGKERPIRHAKEHLPPKEPTDVSVGMGLLCGFAYAAVFQISFYAATLYGSAPQPENRFARWQLMEHAALPAPDGHPSIYALALSRFETPEHLIQRLPLYLAAIVFLAAATLAGDLLRHWIGPEDSGRGLRRWIVAFGLGMGAASLLVQLLGLAGLLGRVPLSIVMALVVTGWVVWWRRRPSPPADRSSDQLAADRPSTIERWALSLLVAPFVLLGLLAAALPTMDYDALAYHLLGPKEYFLAGRISYLPHNVYTSFPFLTEMWSLAGMSLFGDWFLGGLFGQIVIATFGLAGGLAVGVLAEDLFGERIGWWSAAIYLSTPWIYRLSVHPYVEGPLLFYGVLTLLASLEGRMGRWRWALVSGLLAGFAVGCKYTGVVFVGLPAFVVLVAMRDGRLACRLGAIFVGGMLLSAGPWFLRNLLWTGNPVYPLLFELFGVGEWTAADAEKFSKGHRPGNYQVGSLIQSAREVLIESDWQSALVFAFAPLAFLHRDRRKALSLWLLVLGLFGAFWLLTHRLDRFWLPLEPFAVVLAGVGMCWSARLNWKLVAWLSFSVAVFYNLAYCTTPLVGLPYYTADIHEARLRGQGTAIQLVNSPEFVAPDETVLFVGLAAVYNALPDARYNTVFDRNLLEKLVRDPDGDGLRPTEEIRQAFEEEGIDVVLVDWSWIELYRSAGNYGFPDFVTPKVFQELTSRGMLRPVQTPLGPASPIQVYRVTDGPLIGRDSER
ncbi:ArnT family glycosyltransferase [Kolteria novifilia]|uniref:ArnT family glycosyltransferase n=1 Tax=Kolteria novifilia TaxID=2527975 RepID=UPI003AF3B638